MNTILIAVLILLGLAGIAAVGFLVWMRVTLLSGIATVDANEVNPDLRKEIERLELDYAVAEELGYPGEVLLGIESQLNAAKLKAAGDAEASTVVLVHPSSPTTEQAPIYRPVFLFVDYPGVLAGSIVMQACVGDDAVILAPAVWGAGETITVPPDTL